MTTTAATTMKAERLSISLSVKWAQDGKRDAIENRIEKNGTIADVRQRVACLRINETNCIDNNKWRERDKENDAIADDDFSHLVANAGLLIRCGRFLDRFVVQNANDFDVKNAVACDYNEKWNRSDNPSQKDHGWMKW